SKNKQLVLNDGCANGTAKLTPESGWNEPAGDRVRIGLGKLIACIGCVRTAVKKGTAMNIIGSGLRRGGDQGCADLPELGVVAGSVDFRLRDRIQVWHDQHISIEKVTIVGAVQDRVHPNEHLTIHLYRQTALRIFRGSVPPAELNGTRSNQKKL